MWNLKDILGSLFLFGGLAIASNVSMVQNDIKPVINKISKAQIVEVHVDINDFLPLTLIASTHTIQISGSTEIEENPMALIIQPKSAQRVQQTLGSRPREAQKLTQIRN